MTQWNTKLFHIIYLTYFIITITHRSYIFCAQSYTLKILVPQQSPHHVNDTKYTGYQTYKNAYLCLIDYRTHDSSDFANLDGASPSSALTHKETKPDTLPCPFFLQLVQQYPFLPIHNTIIQTFIEKTQYPIYIFHKQKGWSFSFQRLYDDAQNTIPEKQYSQLNVHLQPLSLENTINLMSLGIVNYTKLLLEKISDYEQLEGYLQAFFCYVYNKNHSLPAHLTKGLVAITLEHQFLRLLIEGYSKKFDLFHPFPVYLAPLITQYHLNIGAFIYLLTNVDSDNFKDSLHKKKLPHTQWLQIRHLIWRKLNLITI
ncbi:MAG: hypothetical protein WBQ73_03990 [Candidatus Babeliales bacterium]